MAKCSVHVYFSSSFLFFVLSSLHSLTHTKWSPNGVKLMPDSASKARTPPLFLTPPSPKTQCIPPKKKNFKKIVVNILFFFLTSSESFFFSICPFLSQPFFGPHYCYKLMLSASLAKPTCKTLFFVSPINSSSPLPHHSLCSFPQFFLVQILLFLHPKTVFFFKRIIFLDARSLSTKIVAFLVVICITTS